MSMSWECYMAIGVNIGINEMKLEMKYLRECG